MTAYKDIHELVEIAGFNIVNKFIMNIVNNVSFILVK